MSTAVVLSMFTYQLEHAAHSVDKMSVSLDSPCGFV